MKKSKKGTYCHTVKLEESFGYLFPDLVSQIVKESIPSFVDLNSISPKSHIKLKWGCPKCGNTWETELKVRAQGYGCNACGTTNKRANKLNNLLLTHPEIAAQWHPTLNYDLTPDKVTSGSDKKVWWKCAEGEDHEWEAHVYNRAKKGRKSTECPFCSGRFASSTNNFAIRNKETINQWDYEKNKGIDPYKILPYAKIEVYRICYKCNISYKTSPHLWTMGRSCSRCDSSYGEKAIMYFLEANKIEYLPEHKFKGCKSKRSLPFDFYLPEHNLCIEFDGKQHYKCTGTFGDEKTLEQTQIRDKIKTNFCIKEGIKLIRIPYWEEKNINIILSNNLLL